jgi:hypothetical protein
MIAFSEFIMGEHLLHSSEIDSIIGDFGNIPEGLTEHKIFQHPQIGAVKIRAYASVREAIHIETELNRLAGKINFPELLGRHHQFLVFRYMEFDNQDETTKDEGFYSHLGEFLGILNGYEVDNVTSESLDNEVFSWLDRFTDMHILSQNIAQKCRNMYLHTRPTDFPIKLDYWDAMPHNFALDAGKLYLLDEKHLRPSYQGVGLIKPYLLFSETQWEQVRQGYQNVLPITIIDENITFLEFYYLLAALYF